MPFLGALVAKEFQTWLRGHLTFLLFTAIVVIVSALVFLLGLLVLAPDPNAAPALFSTTATPSSNLLIAQRPLFLFGAASLCVLLAAAAVAPAIAGSAFAVEREQGTLDLLLVHSGGSGRIVVGKLLAAVLFSLLVLLVALPLFAPPWSFGGVSTDHLIVFATVLLSSTLLFCAIGIFFGAVVPRALQAALFAQATCLFLLFGTLGLYLAFATLGSNDSLRPLLWLNPFLTLISGGGSAAETFSRQAPAPFRPALYLPVTVWPAGISLTPWALGSMISVAASIVLAMAAAVAIDPCHPLKARRRS